VQEGLGGLRPRPVLGQSSSLYQM